MKGKRKCIFCKEEFLKERPMQINCSYTCAAAYAAIQSKKKESKKWREQKKVMKEKIKTLSDYKKELQTKINLIIRLIDGGQGCIATGAITGKMNSGHYFGIGSNDTLRFHLDNIHIQSEHSNSFNSGDTLRYQAGIRKNYGIEYFNHLESLKLIPVIKLSVVEIKEKIAIAKEIIKELQKENRKYTVSERMGLRKKYNLKLGIYKN